MQKKKIDNPVWTKPSCASCMLNIGYLILKKSTNNRELQYEGIKKILNILQNFSIDVFPTEISIRIFRMVQNLTENRDPFTQEKELSNNLGNEMSKQIKLDINKAKTETDRIYKAIIGSIVGNIIDFGTSNHNFSLDIEQFHKLYFENLKFFLEL